MKPQLLKVTHGPVHSFSVRQDLVPYVNNRWHYHPEIELIHFKKGSGMQFIGDNIKQFRENDVVLLGANLPHYWRFDEVYFSDEPQKADVRVAHFNELFWGNTFLQLPENKAIKVLLEKAKRGIQVTGQARNSVAILLEQMLNADGTERLILLIKALAVIAQCDDVRLLSSIGFSNTFEEPENERINAIYEYSMANFKSKIPLEKIAEVAGISTHSFCRYFKSRTRKTYSQFLIEIKIGHACKLLIENKLSVKQLCYESGFNNFASFHKYFKLITGKSPLVYQKGFVHGKIS